MVDPQTTTDGETMTLQVDSEEVEHLRTAGYFGRVRASNEDAEDVADAGFFLENAMTDLKKRDDVDRIVIEGT
jgi:hypothetical protein